VKLIDTSLRYLMTFLHIDGPPCDAVGWQGGAGRRSAVDQTAPALEPDQLQRLKYFSFTGSRGPRAYRP
jgi:hypothetical protein